MLNYSTLIFGGSSYQTKSYQKMKMLDTYVRNMVTTHELPPRGYKDKIINVVDGLGRRVYRGKIGRIPKDLRTQSVDNRSRNGYDKDTKEVIISLVAPYEKKKRK